MHLSTATFALFAMVAVAQQVPSVYTVDGGTTIAQTTYTTTRTVYRVEQTVTAIRSTSSSWTSSSESSVATISASSTASAASAVLIPSYSINGTTTALGTGASSGLLPSATVTAPIEHINAATGFAGIDMVVPYIAAAGVLGFAFL